MWWTDCGAQSSGTNNRGTSNNINSWDPTFSLCPEGPDNLIPEGTLYTSCNWAQYYSASGKFYNHYCQQNYKSWGGCKAAAEGCPSLGVMWTCYNTIGFGEWAYGPWYCQYGTDGRCLPGINTNGPNIFTYCIKACDMYHRGMCVNRYVIAGCYYWDIHISSTCGTNNKTVTCGPYTSVSNSDCCTWVYGECLGKDTPSPTNPMTICYTVRHCSGAFCVVRYCYSLRMNTTGCCNYMTDNCMLCNGFKGCCLRLYQCTGAGGNFSSVQQIFDSSSRGGLGSGCCFYLPMGAYYGGYSTQNMLTTNSFYALRNSICCIWARYFRCHCSYQEGCLIYGHNFFQGTTCNIYANAGTETYGTLSVSLPYYAVGVANLEFQDYKYQNYGCLAVYYTYATRPWTSSLCK